MKKALVIGALGQDGSYMCEHLFSNEFIVVGLCKKKSSIEKLKWLSSLVPNMEIVEMDILLDRQSFVDFLQKNQFDQIYNFAAYSNVFSPYGEFEEVIKTNATMVQFIIESIVKTNIKTKFFQASSCLIYGNSTLVKPTENTMPRPIYTYGNAKLFADNIIQDYNIRYINEGFFGCSGILFPHESPRRGNDFFTKKVCKAASIIKNNGGGEFVIGNLSGLRDWSYAPDVVEAAYMMLNNNSESPENYIIGSGELTEISEFVKLAFEYVGLNYLNHIRNDEKYSKHSDINTLLADYSKIENNLGWRPSTNVEGIVEHMMEFELKNIN